MTSLKSRIKALEELNQQKEAQHIWFREGCVEVYRSEGNLIYYPSKTALKFNNILGDDTKAVTLVMGAFGSGKSTMEMQFVVKHASMMPRWHAGRRRARWAFIRNTTGELYSTTLKTWLEWFGELGDITSRQKPILTYEHLFSDGEGLIELEVFFVALDNPKDVKKLKSFDLTGIFLNELCEIHKSVLDFCTPRVHRYPSKIFCEEPYWSGIIADTNPPDEDHWIYKQFVQKPVKGYTIYQQPPGLLLDEKGDFVKTPDGDYVANPEAENVINLKNPNYYPDFARGKGMGFIKAYCQGQFSLVEMGKRVYDEYNDDIHSVDRLDILPDLPIHLGWDFGLTPACVVVQVTPRGQFRILKEYLSDRMGIRNFAKMIVIPSLKADFPGLKIGFSDADPAGLAADSIMEDLSCIGELNLLGITTEAAETNDPIIRQAAVRFFLTSLSDGKVSLLVDRQNAPVTHKGFVSGYVLRRMRVAGDERFSEQPDKNMFSHPHDGVQYIALRFATLQIDQHKPNSTLMDMRNPTCRAMGSRF
jgi:hypothetical protein